MELKDDSKTIKESEYNLDYKPIYPSIKDNFKFPPLIGLSNVGAIEYMNAILQCLCNIEKFANFFKYNKNVIKLVKNDKNKKSLTSSFKLLIEKLWPNNYDNNNTLNEQKYYSPFEFKAKINSMKEEIKIIDRNSLKNFIDFIINKLHNELNLVKNEGVVSDELIDRRNFEQVYDSFIKDFYQNNQS